MLVSGDGSLVVVGSVGASRRCEMVRLNTSTLRESSFVVPACGTWATWSGRSVLLVVDQYVKGTNDDEQLRIERVNPRNGTAILGPAVMPLVGSQIAHVGYAYGDDSLWIAGNTPEGSLLVQVSPATGQLLQQWVLPVGFDTAVATADDDGAWFSSTPEGASNPGLYHVVAGNPTVTKVNDLTGTIGTSWLQAEGNEVVALLTPPLQSSRQAAVAPQFHRPPRPGGNDGSPFTRTDALRRVYTGCRDAGRPRKPRSPVSGLHDGASQSDQSGNWRDPSGHTLSFRRERLRRQRGQ